VALTSSIVRPHENSTSIRFVSVSRDHCGGRNS
jgi:hypothetical protein